MKPIEGFVTPSDLEAKVAALETKLDGLLSKKFRVGTAHAVQLMETYTPSCTRGGRAQEIYVKSVRNRNSTNYRLEKVT